MKRPASDARVLANRRNAKLSTGPRTPEGKERSRANAREHGLTGEGIALSTEDTQQVAARFDGMVEELAPKTLVGLVLVKVTAMLSVRLDRSYEQEANRLSARVQSAETDLIDKRKAQAEHLLQTITHTPATNHRRPRSTPTGVDLLIEKWIGMKRDLDHTESSRWSYNHQVMAEALIGRETGMIDHSAFSCWSDAMFGNFEYIRPAHFEGMTTDDERKSYAMDRLADLIDAEIASLKAHRETLDTRALDAEMRFASKIALFDTSKEAILARKYEAAALRGLHRALEELREVEAEGEIPMAVATAPPGPEPVPQSEVKSEEKPVRRPVGSFFRASEREAAKGKVKARGKGNKGPGRRVIEEIA